MRAEDIGSRWINSGGGPLICGEERSLLTWRGSDGRSAFSGKFASDYWAACAVDSYIGTLQGPEGPILVLGDEPLQSRFMHDRNGRLLIVRWEYAELEFDPAVISDSLDDAAVALEASTVLSVGTPSLVMMDAAFPFPPEDAAPGGALVSWTRTQLPPVRYSIATKRLREADRYSMLVHAFNREN